jgi:hypothetical protein
MNILTMVTLDWIWNIKIIGLIAGPITLFVWWLILKVNSGGVFEGNNLPPTLFLAPIGLVLVVLSAYLFLFSDPWRSKVYVVNHSQQPGYLELDGERFLVAAGEWEEISFRTAKETFSAKGYIGDSIVFDTVMGVGAYVSLLGGNKFLLAEEWVYSNDLEDVDRNDLVYELLEMPGIAKFTDKVNPKVYDFDEEAPPTIDTENFSSDIHAFDLSILNEDQLMQEYYKGILESGLNYDSLMKELTVEPLEIDSTIIEE